MPRSLKLACVSALASISLWAPSARANLEPPAWADARAAALGGTGVAYTFNGAAPYQNPALLQGIDRMAFTLAVTPIIPSLQAPFNGPSADPVSSTKSVFPLFLLGGAYRVHDRIVLGLALYPTSGAGAKYEKLAALGGNDLSASIAAIEISPAISFAILKNLSIGLGYRMTYATQSASAVQAVQGQNGMPMLVKVDTSLKGFNFAAMDAGLYWQPLKQVGFGFAYRSKMSASLSGTTVIAGAPGLDTKSSFTTPHTFRIGTAVEAIEDHLTFALELKYLMYKDALTSVDTTITTPAGTQKSTTDYNFHDAVAVGFGIEGRPIPLLALRAGYSESSSATSPSSPQPILPAPAPIRTAHWGLGLKFTHVDVDLAGMYSFCNATVSSPTAPALPGTYGFNSLYFASSVTYHR